MKRLRIGIIGAGFMGEYHARAYRAAAGLYGESGIEPQLAIVADPVVGSADQVAARWGVDAVTADWRQVVDDSTVDVIDVCAPPANHFEICSAALDAGKVVYCEKPVGKTPAETIALASKASAGGSATYVGFNYRWIPAVVLARQLILEGAIGDILHVLIFKDTDSAADPSKDGWRYYADKAGAGSLSDVGSHVFDMARYLAGELASVNGLTQTLITKRGAPDNPLTVDTDDLWVAFAQFANGASGVFRGSRVLHGNKADMRIEIYGRGGSIRWSQECMNELRLFQPTSDGLDGFRTVRIGPAHADHGRFVPVRGHAIGFPDLKTIEVGNLMLQVGQHLPPRPNFADAAAVARILDAVPKRQWTDVAGSTNDE